MTFVGGGTFAVGHETPVLFMRLGSSEIPFFCAAIKRQTGSKVHADQEINGRDCMEAATDEHKHA